MAAELPAEFFIFVDRVSLVTRSNYDLGGSFSSRCASLLFHPEGIRRYESGEIDLLPFRPNPDQYPDLSPFVVQLMTEQWIEYEAERLRRTLCPSAPSRLSAIYAFGDQQTCLDVAKKYGWPLESVRRFKLAPGEPYRAIRVNMEVVSLMPGIFRLGTWKVEDSNHIWSPLLARSRESVHGDSGRGGVYGASRMGLRGYLGVVDRGARGERRQDAGIRLRPGRHGGPLWVRTQVRTSAAIG
jgi:hypothetical protein